MKNLVFLSLLLFLMGCSRRISPYFIYNKYVPDIYYHIINDSLQLYHKAFADFDYLTDARELKKMLRKNKYHFNNVLLYGKTNLDNSYEYFLLVNSTKKKFIGKSNGYIKDTILANQNFTFVGFPLDQNDPKADFDQIFDNIVVGPNYRKKIISLNGLIDRFYRSNRFFKAYQEISDFPAYDESEEWFKFQMRLTYASFLGPNEAYHALLQKWDRGPLNDTVIGILKQKSIQGFSAVKKFILSQSKDQKLVMFNENHFYPNHRKLLTQLLAGFKEMGFNYLALEALGKNQDSLLNSGEPLNLETGFYTREQNYAALIRTAQSLGYELVAYENTDREKNREFGQAENLYQKTFAKDKHAKVLVLAGIAHVTETPDGRGKKWMASIFKEKFNIDPLTFSQTILNRYRKLTQTVRLITSKEFEQERYRATDFIVINNLPLREGKGNFEYKNEFDYSVQIALFDDSKLKTENSFWDKVPVKSFLLKPKETYSTNLNFNEVRILLFDKSGELLKNEKIVLADKGVGRDY